jgi:hypothetical protein
MSRGLSLSRPEAVVTAQAQDFKSLSPSKPSRAVTSLYSQGYGNALS